MSSVFLRKNTDGFELHVIGCDQLGPHTFAGGVQTRLRYTMQVAVPAAPNTAFGYDRGQFFADHTAVAERVVQEGENLAAVLFLQLLCGLEGKAEPSGLALDDFFVLWRIGAVDKPSARAQMMKSSACTASLNSKVMVERPSLAKNFAFFALVCHQ